MRSTKSDGPPRAIDAAPKPRFRGKSARPNAGLRGTLDRRLAATCVSCGAHIRRWRELLADDDTAAIRIAIDSAGKPMLRATCADACDVCGGPEMKIATAAR